MINERKFNDVAVSEKKFKIIQFKYASERLIKYFTYQKYYFEDIKKFNKNKKNGESRINRYEGREALYQVSKALFLNIDLSTMEVESRSGVRLTHSILLNACEGLSVHRYKRAFLKLCKAGFIETERRFDIAKSKKYFALPSVKRITYKFFKALGIDKYYQIGKNWKIKKLEQNGVSRKIRNYLENNINLKLPLSTFVKNKQNFKNTVAKTENDFSEVKLNKYSSYDELRKNLLKFKINEYLKNNPQNEDIFIKFKNIIYSYSEEMLLKASKNVGFI